MIQFSHLTIANDLHRPLIENQSLSIANGTLTALIGRNGCGKSTLLRTIAGIQKPIAGTVEVNDVDVYSASAKQLSRLIAIINTEFPQIQNLTCRELVAYGRAPYTGLLGRLTAADDAIVDRALETVGMSNFATRKINRISDGERRRIMLARALAQQTPIILLDEPTSFLDAVGRVEITELLSRLAHTQGKTIIYSTHELDPAFANADTVLLMSSSGLRPVSEPFTF